VTDHSGNRTDDLQSKLFRWGGDDLFDALLAIITGQGSLATTIAHIVLALLAYDGVYRAPMTGGPAGPGQLPPHSIPAVVVISRNVGMIDGRHFASVDSVIAESHKRLGAGQL
jgi:hypothetical protein